MSVVQMLVVVMTCVLILKAHTIAAAVQVFALQLMGTHAWVSLSL